MQQQVRSYSRTDPVEYSLLDKAEQRSQKYQQSLTRKNYGNTLHSGISARITMLQRWDLFHVIFYEEKKKMPLNLPHFSFLFIIALGDVFQEDIANVS